MIKSELIAKLAAENPHLTQQDIERVVGVILDSMIEALEARRPGRAARLRRLFGALPPGPRRPQPAHRRGGHGARQARALLQERQGTARAAERQPGIAARRQFSSRRHRQRLECASRVNAVIRRRM